MSETCSECGASVNDYDKHQSWHFDLARRIEEAVEEAKRAAHD